jgi:FkbM family methyltransferase
MLKTIRSRMGDALRSLGLYPLYERLYCRVKYPLPIRFTFDGITVPLRIEALSTRRFLSSFERGEGELMRFFFAHTKQGDCVWDVGANKGVIGLLLAQKIGGSGRVFAFEPEAVTFRALRANARRVERGAKVTPVPLALGDCDGEFTLHLCRGGEHTLLAPAGPTEHSQTIRVRRGDAFATGDVQRPNVMKIDVEGAEFEVLAGMPEILADPRLRCIGIELHPDIVKEKHPNALADLKALLGGYGFSVEGKTQRGTEIHCLCLREAAGAQ